MRTAMPPFCPSFLGRDSITCPAALSTSSKLNSSVSVMPLPSSIHPLTFPCQAPHAWSSCLFASGHPFNTAENGCCISGFKWRKQPFGLALSYRQLQKVTDFEWGQVCKAAAFLPSFLRKLQKHTSKLHRLQWNHSVWQYWSDLVPTELKQGQAYAPWCSSIWRNLQKQKYRGHLSLVLHFS